MNIERNNKEYKKIFEVLVGSHAYNLNDEKSDEDFNGIFYVPSIDYLKLYPEPPQQFLSHTKEKDVTFFSFKRFFELSSFSNPNFLELFWSDPKNIIYKDPVMDLIFEHKDVFLSQKAYFTYGSYAMSQIKKSKGQNKWVSNPKSKNRPVIEDFCYFISKNNKWGGMPFRPYKVDFPLDLFNISKVERSHNLYRLYYYGNEANGVFKNGNLILSSIPKKDERKKFKGVLIINEDEYNKELKDWNNYWEWIKNRNEERWTPKGAKESDCNYKNLSHCIRLLFSAINIFENRQPIVYLEGEKRDIVLNIKKGLVEYEEILKMAKDLNDKLDTIFNENKKSFEKVPNKEKINDLFLMCIDQLESK
jgi:hypothetical protein